MLVVCEKREDVYLKNCELLKKFIYSGRLKLILRGKKALYRIVIWINCVLLSIKVCNIHNGG
jgi:hypothetical protein